MSLNIGKILDNEISPEVILNQLDECGKTELDFFKVFLDVYFHLGGKNQKITKKELRTMNKEVWSSKWTSDGTNETLMPKDKNNEMECIVAFNTFKAIGSFMETQNKKVFEKYKSIFKECHDDENLSPKTPLDTPRQPLIAAGKEILTDNKWKLEPSTGPRQISFYGVFMNFYRLELCSMMGSNEKFKQAISILMTLSQRFCEYVLETKLGHAVFDWLLKQAVEKNGTAELVLSLMLSANLYTEYFRHQCNDTSHNSMDKDSLKRKRHLLNFEGLNKIYYSMVVDPQLTKDHEKGICTWETLQGLDFLHQMFSNNFNDAFELSIPFVELWLYSGFPLAVAMCIRILRYMVEIYDDELKEYKNLLFMTKIRRFLFLLISHNKDNSEVCEKYEGMPERIPLLTEEEIAECSEVYGHIATYFKGHNDPNEIRLLTKGIKTQETLKPIVNMVYISHKDDLKKKPVELSKFMEYSIKYSCRENQVLFNNLLLDTAGVNSIILLKAFFNNKFRSCLEDKPNEKSLEFTLMAIGLLEEIIKVLEKLSESRKDNVFIQAIKEFNMLEIFKNIFDNSDKYYSILNPGLKLLIYVLKLNTAWFTTMDNVNIFKDYAEKIFIKTHDKITISLLHEVFEFFYLWTRNFHGVTSTQFKVMAIYLNQTLFKDCNDILKNKFYTLLSTYNGIDLSLEYAVVKFGILPPSKYVYQVFDHILIQLKNFGTPQALRVKTEIGVQMWRHVLQNFKLNKNVIDWELFNNVSEHFNDLVDELQLKLARPVAEYLKSIFQMSSIEKEPLKRSEFIDKMMNEKLLNKLAFIITKEIFGEKPFYFCSSASKLQTVYLNMPLTENVDQKNCKLFASFESLILQDKQKIMKESERMLHTYKLRSEESLLGNEKNIQSVLNHANVRLAKLCTIDDPLEDWESKGNLLSCLKYVFISSKNDNIRKKIKDAVEWLYAFTLLCPYGKYEDLFVHVKYCIALKPDDQKEKQAFIDRIGLMIFAILDNANNLSDELKHEFARNAIKKLSSK
uniref:LisH domain-containing protein n=1 Tax=Parastrongyloides trichosuri TaxID=131310 RepID=A0A0N5A6T0_PARTI